MYLEPVPALEGNCCRIRRRIVRERDGSFRIRARLRRRQQCLDQLRGVSSNVKPDLVPSTVLGTCVDCPSTKFHEHAAAWLELALCSVLPPKLRCELWEENRPGFLLFHEAPLAISRSTENMKILTMQSSKYVGARALLKNLNWSRDGKH